MSKSQHAQPAQTPQKSQPAQPPRPPQAAKFINRELSWIEFNSRVLRQCERDIPLLEKLKFIAIYSTNLDEFYMIRMAGLMQLVAAGMGAGAFKDGEMTPAQQLDECRAKLKAEQAALERFYHDTTAQLAQKGLQILAYSRLDPALRAKADEFFATNILPVIVPVAIDSTHPFPPLNNLSFGLVMRLQDVEHAEIEKLALVRISRLLPRFWRAGGGVYVPIESIVEQHAAEIFRGYTLKNAAAFRVTRNADIVIEEEEADDFMLILEQGLKTRRKGKFVRLQVEADADASLVDFLAAHLKVAPADIYRYNTPLTLGALWQLVGDKDFSNLNFAPFTPKVLPPFNEDESVFQVMDRGDALLFHPYESFEPVARFVKEAAKDPKVISIRMTLYRAEKNSEIIRSLIDAASEGKQVTVMVELKARFDEESNIHWAKALEEAGAHVIYGIAGFKVHAKVTQVIRQVGGRLDFYVHLGTGNYNASSAKIYTDVSYFTRNAAFAADTTAFFHMLSGYNKERQLQSLSMSPMQMKECLLKMIAREAEFGTSGRIIAKMNALVDEDMIGALYAASNAGVEIDLIVRGICCLRPGVAGLSENIRVRSIVGKYLEHARILYFAHGEPRFYIASADWMPRNLERRLELMTPIFDEKLGEKLGEILQKQLADNVLAWQLGADGGYVPCDAAWAAASAGAGAGGAAGGANSNLAGGGAGGAAGATNMNVGRLDSQEFFEILYNNFSKQLKNESDKSKAKLLASKLFTES